MSPTILFIPGFWEGPGVFEEVSSLLQTQGHSTQMAKLASTGTLSPGNPSMLDDIAAIRSAVTKLAEAGKDIVMVLHSGGGFLGSNAIKGLSTKARSEEKLKGGVSKMVFLTGALFPEGFKHGPLPFAISEKGAMYCITPEKLLFNDLDDMTTKKWMNELKPQPAEGWDDTITYCGWKDVPSTYLICESDACIPLPMQLQMAEMAGSKIEKCNAGHMVMLSMPGRVVDIIKSAAEGS